MKTKVHIEFQQFVFEVIERLENAWPYSLIPLLFAILLYPFFGFVIFILEKLDI